MIDEKINTVIDLGKSKVKIGVFDEDKKIIFASSEEIETKSEENNISKTIKKVIRKSEKEISNHIDKIILLFDDPNFFTIDISIKKNIDQILTPQEIQNLAFLDCSQIINQSQKNIRILNFFVSKVIIDEKEFAKLPDDLKDNLHIIFEFKFLCLPNDNLDKIKNVFNENNINIKNIFCSSLVRSNAYVNLFKNEKYVGFLDIGLFRSTLNIFFKKKLQLIKNIPIGSHSITKDISYIMKLNLDESEKIKQLFNRSETDFSFTGKENGQEKLIKDIIGKKIQIDLLKQVILARIDEIFKLLLGNNNFLNQNFVGDELLLVLIGRGSKIFDKNSFNFESIYNFKDIIFYDETTEDICKLGLEHAKIYNLSKEHSKKSSKKQGIFEKFFNLFQKI